MALKNIYQRIAAHEPVRAVLRWTANLNGSVPASLHVKGMAGSTSSFLIRGVANSAGMPVVCITPDEEAAAYLHGDLAPLFSEESDLLRLPATGHKPYDDEQMDDPGPLVRRADVLQQLAEGFEGLIVTSIDAMFEMAPPVETIRKETIIVSVGTAHPPGELAGRLLQLGFERVEFVEQPGELALRGGILDVYPFAGDYPIRAEFFGDEIDSIREFDPATQRSVSRLTSARLVPNLERRQGGQIAQYTSIFEHLPDKTLIVTFDEQRIVERTVDLYQRASEAYVQAVARNGESALQEPSTRYLTREGLERALLTHSRILVGTFVPAVAEETRTIDSSPQPDFNGNIALLRKRILANAQDGIETFVLCDSRGQEQRLFELLEEEATQHKVRFSVESLHQGFQIDSLGLAVYTDHQIFNRYHRPSTRGRKRRYGGLSLREIQNLSPGDFVVHVDYGVGKFAGLHKITVREAQQEAVKILFKDDDVLYVNVNALYKLHKYSGKEGHQPKLTKLGSGQWERAKSRTKKKVKDIARDLIKLYAQRKASDGLAFSADTIWQREMEASFRFEDTPDQATAAEAIKEDMEEPVPMDRLVCGDVGFGKTEVAIRAAFKAAQDGTQVAILVPTTILATQHFETFKARLSKYPVRVDVISRFRTAAEQKQILKDLASGEIDILIGTHRLTSKDVKFKNLGLLIVDEEQRFGVSVKERLRKLRAEVDTLTLTATPIPRTLQFSLLGARDLSIISTPPPNRQPIETEIHTFDKDLIRDAILYEISRGGQVFFIHNRVQSIDEMSSMLRAVIPDIRIRTAHGQMKSTALENVMVDFIAGKFDVLVSTNIIENGLDISNANTIIINRADRFGLAELHQLRGRVGRSDRKAFCYLLVPSIHGLTREARQRLQAVEEFSDLGSGFSLAMRDMDIRGAGNLLGGEQSGFIEDVGFETYHKILDEAVQELREEEFKDVFEQDHVPNAGETAVDVEEDAYIPGEYVSNNLERLNIYRRISEAENSEVLETIRGELSDRFGNLPPEVENLMTAAEIKLLANALRLPKVLFKNERLFLYTPDQENDAYFYENVFYVLLEQLSTLGRRYVLKDNRGKKLRAIVQDVPDLSAAKEVLTALQLTGKVAA